MAALGCCSITSRRFGTRKIVEATHRIHAGLDNQVVVGNLDISRDWGRAPDYVEAIWVLLQRETPLDVVIATEPSHSNTS